VCVKRGDGVCVEAFQPIGTDREIGFRTSRSSFGLNEKRGEESEGGAEVAAGQLTTCKIPFPAKRKSPPSAFCQTAFLLLKAYPLRPCLCLCLPSPNCISEARARLCAPQTDGGGKIDVEEVPKRFRRSREEAIT
jgi:hypothetical protein